MRLAAGSLQATRIALAAGKTQFDSRLERNGEKMILHEYSKSSSDHVN